ncbi:MAG: chemotaxis protein CheV [Lachnospiraceae bacterium]|nr:chemotaxis protein CheV [Lachnospiraceae bacterium]
MSEAMANETGILLESGTNELELLEFVVGTQHYGINVAKISELCPYQEPTMVPNAHPFIEGIFMPRERLITVINLARALGLPENQDTKQDMYIITNFNRIYTAFHVQQVLGIHRVSWEDITKPDSTINGGGKGIATGITKIDGKIIIVLDFEKIVTEVNPETGLKLSEVEAMGERDRHDCPILLAEDSPLLLEMLKKCLIKAGYTNLIPTTNGLEAWNKLEEIMAEDGVVGKDIALVITDIEMPQMDGHHLAKRIKTEPKLEGLPVVIFSSLVNEEMRRKGEALGVDAQMSKPEIGRLVHQLDLLLG